MIDYRTMLAGKTGDPEVFRWASKMLDRCLAAGQKQEADELIALISPEVGRMITEHKYIPGHLHTLLPLSSFIPFQEEIFRTSQTGGHFYSFSPLLSNLDPDRAGCLIFEYAKSAKYEKSGEHMILKSLEKLAPAQAMEIAAVLLDRHVRSFSASVKDYALVYATAWRLELPGVEKIRFPKTVWKEKNGMDFLIELNETFTGSFFWFGLAMDAGSDWLERSFADYSRLFRQGCDLEFLDRLSLSSREECLEILTQYGYDHHSVAVRLAHRVVSLIETDDEEVLLPHFAAGLLAWEMKKDQPDWSGCGIEELLEYAGTIAFSPSGTPGFIEAVRSCDQSETSMMILSAWDEEDDPDICVPLLDLMINLNYPEFIDSLLDIEEDIYDVSEKFRVDLALASHGQVIVDSIRERWSDTTEDERQYYLNIIDRLDGSLAVPFLCEIFPFMRSKEIDFWCSKAEHYPDDRTLDLLIPELRRRQPDIDETAMLLAKLLDRTFENIEEVQSRMTREPAEMGSSQHLDCTEKPLEVVYSNLNCPLCGDSNTYCLEKMIFHVEHGDSQLLYMMPAEDKECLSCGKLTALKRSENDISATLALRQDLMWWSKHPKARYTGPFFNDSFTTLSGSSFPLARYYVENFGIAHSVHGSASDILHLAYCLFKTGADRTAALYFKKAHDMDHTYPEAALYYALCKGEDYWKELFEMAKQCLKVRSRWKVIGFDRRSKREFYDEFKDFYYQGAEQSGEEVEELSFGMPDVVEKKVGRNELCPCGSGKKYKKCCMN